MTTDSSTVPAPRWVRADGVQLLGAASGSGLVDTTYLVRRGDGQLLQVSELLHLVVRELAPGRAPEEVADAVTRSFGRRLSTEGLNQLISGTLSPLGLVADGNRRPDPEAVQPRADPLLSLRFRGTLLPEPLVNALAGALRPAFYPPIVVLVLAALVVLDVVLFLQGGILQALDDVLKAPVLLLGLMVLLMVGALIHELGHATACRYGGARPGVIGYGIYIVFPAFFTNVTDSYRLGRAGRLRTDLGGLYFNVWCLLAAGTGYLLTGNGLLLLVVVVMQLEMVQQLIPTVRFDGYFVLADLAGVPDLFARVKPVLASLLPGRPVHPLVAEMKPVARWIVTLWVLTVVPTLVLGLGWMLISLPVILSRTFHAMQHHASLLAQAVADGALAEFILAVLSIVMLCLPLLGLAVLLQKLAAMLAKLAARWLRRRAGSRR
ncbi:hypothetical protein LVY72_00860 [Arthrobacter sp. I2-34]|uniref:Peptide zinc metalloprotease protein n=1 Tax=Arthrobacter hankyongi TaxID=2904801 RepID=A0ABS9L1E6_9MICC|nr:hypothetical protein [Arthrobacter hankyongi]MCG2620458.1 hypothetical protein [Arthrobacter hankyongi]